MSLTPSTANEADITALVAVLSATAVGATVEYRTLSDALGSDVRQRRYLLLAAMRRLNADCGAIFGNIKGVGYKRLAAAETGLIGSNARRKMRHTARNASKVMANSLDRANDLPPDVQRRVVAEIATMSMIAHLTRENVVKAQVATEKPPTLAESLRGVMKHIGATP